MKRLAVVFTILAISAVFAQGSYSAMDDKSDLLSNEQTGIFSPGYINATKQKTDAIINQINGKKNNLSNTSAEYMDTNLSDKVKEDAMNKPTLELKKKTSQAVAASGEAKDLTAAAKTDMRDSSKYNNIGIGSGTNKTYDSSGRMISEVIDGQRFMYVGFDNIGKSSIIDAVRSATAGDNILVKAGTYSLSLERPDGRIVSLLQVRNGISLYGGYNEAGSRDVVNNTTTLINGYLTASFITKPTEIDGFTLDIAKSGSGVSASYSQNLTISNNIFVSSDSRSLGIVANSAFLDIRNNIFNVETAIYVYGKNAPSPILQYSGSSSYIQTKNNDFNGSIGISSGGHSIIKSVNDYFSGGQFIDRPGSAYTADVSIVGSSLRPTVQVDTAQSINAGLSNYTTNDLSYNKRDNSDIYQSSLLAVKTLSPSDAGAISSIFKSLLGSKDALMVSATGQVDPALLIKLVGDSLERSALSIPMTGINGPQMELALALANILKNPTQDQKEVLSVVESLLNMVNNIEGQSGSPELKKASDDLLQAVAAILIAQAIPDLLKEGDVSNVKNIFSELNTSKGKIILEYQESVKPYYDETKKLLSKNIALLQLNNILSKNMMEQELSKLEPNEVDKILDKIRKMEKKGFEEEYILQQEAKYRKQYIDPNKKLLKEKMKAMMGSFTKRLSKVLEAVNTAKK
ncbi:MAG: hypothetical protein Q8R38_08565 [Candidatus Omnitrophota bacterium]|nr:hypothetical protein [Candidatus Omnitrophota bacterium]